MSIDATNQNRKAEDIEVSRKPPIHHTCSYCDETLMSRNKLFKHLERCVVKRKSECGILRDVEDVISNTTSSDVYIYAVGGRHRGRTLGFTERYSFRKNKWETCVPMLANRGSHGCAAIGECIYAIGGGGFRSNLSTCEKYNTITSKWEEIKAMKTCCHALTVLGAGNSIFAVGGWIEGSVCSTNCERFDTSSGEWATLASMKVARRMAGACVNKNGNIYVFGGLCSNGDHLSTEVQCNGWYTNSAECFDTSRGEWHDICKLPFKGQASAASVGSDVFVFVHGAFVYRYSPETDKYVNLSRLPETEWYSFDVTTFGRRILLCGGTIEGKWSTVLYSFDTISGTFEKLLNMTMPRRRMVITAIEINN
jgi:hypothetical protein